MFAMAAAILAACSKDMTEDTVGTSGSATANSLLQVTTRGTNDATVAYPVQVYVFRLYAPRERRSDDEYGDCAEGG